MGWEVRSPVQHSTPTCIYCAWLWSEGGKSHLEDALKRLPYKGVSDCCLAANKKICKGFGTNSAFAYSQTVQMEKTQDHCWLPWTDRLRKISPRPGNTAHEKTQKDILWLNSMFLTPHFLLFAFRLATHFIKRTMRL